MSLSERKREALAAKTKRPRELPLAKEAPGRRTVASPKKQIEARMRGNLRRRSTRSLVALPPPDLSLATTAARAF